MKRIRRFPRRASDAHLLTPPDTKPFTCVLTQEDDMRPHTALRMLMNEFGFRDHWNGPGPKIADVTQGLIQAGIAEEIITEQIDFGWTHQIRLRRRPKLSKNTLDHLPPLIRQRLKHSTP